MFIPNADASVRIGNSLVRWRSHCLSILRILSSCICFLLRIFFSYVAIFAYCCYHDFHKRLFFNKWKKKQKKHHSLLSNNCFLSCLRASSSNPTFRVSCKHSAVGHTPGFDNCSSNFDCVEWATAACVVLQQRLCRIWNTLSISRNTWGYLFWCIYVSAILRLQSLLQCLSFI